MKAKTIGTRIRALRKARGLRQSELADKAGIRQQTLYRQESGAIENPRIGTLSKIAEALDVPIHELIGPAKRPATRATARPPSRKRAAPYRGAA